MRKFQFQNDYYYHIYNRGVDKRNIFLDDKDFIRFIRSMRKFNNSLIHNQRDYLKRKEEKLYNLLIAGTSNQEVNDDVIDKYKFAPIVEIITYCLNLNHYHFLLKQLSENGITYFMQKLNNGYAQYFNIKYNRSGSLFEGTYKAIQIKTDEYLQYLSAYINGNPEIHKIAKAEDWPWSSYLDYLDRRKGTLCNKDIILKDFLDVNEYKNYVKIVIKESRQRRDNIEKYLLE